MKKDKLKKISVRLPEETLKVIEELGNNLNLTQSKVIRTILNDYIQYYKTYGNGQ